MELKTIANGIKNCIKALFTPNKKGLGFLGMLFTPMGALLVGLLVVGYLAATDKVKLPSFAAVSDGAVASTAGVALSGVDCAAEAKGCFIEDATVRWNDIDALAAGTDGATPIWIASRATTIADDATATFGVGTETEVIYGDASNAYFREKGKLCVPCSGDVDVVHKLYAGGIPTITVINSDGATVNSATAQQAVAANGQPTFLVKIRAGSDTCAASPTYGSLAIVHFDRDAITRVDSSLSASPYPITSLPLRTVSTAVDAQVAFLWNEPGVLLCDNKQIEFTISPLYDGDNPTAADGNITIEWFPVQLWRSTIDNSFGIGVQNNAGTLQRAGANESAIVFVT